MFKLEFSTDNAAFGDFDEKTDNPVMINEVCEILKGIIDSLNYGNTNGKAIDRNGNTVGSWTLKGE